MEYKIKQVEEIFKLSDKMDKVIIDLVNFAIKNGATKNDIYKIFDRDDVSRKSNHNLVSKYHKLYSEDKIEKDLMEANEYSKENYINNTYKNE